MEYGEHEQKSPLDFLEPTSGREVVRIVFYNADCNGGKWLRSMGSLPHTEKAVDAVAEAAHSNLEWLPQEVVLFADGLLEQRVEVELATGASWLGMDVVRLGRSAAGETLGRGCWRSRLRIRRLGPGIPRWELADPPGNQRRQPDNRTRQGRGDSA